MTRGQIIALARRRLYDNVTDASGSTANNLWPDDELNVYLEESILEACRRSPLITDSTSDLTVLDITQGSNTYPLDKRITHIDQITLSDESREPLKPERINDWEFGRCDGIPTRFTADWDNGLIILDTNPDQDYPGSRMTINRFPLVSLNDSLFCDPGISATTPEIPGEYHFQLIHWIVHLAFMNADLDTIDWQRSQKAEMDFAQVFGPPRDAARRRRILRKPITETRAYFV